MRDESSAVNITTVLNYVEYIPKTNTEYETENISNYMRTSLF